MADQAGPRAAGWRKDPTGRHYARYWDGEHWTQHIASAERVRGVDPQPPPPDPPLFPDGPPPPAPMAEPVVPARPTAPVAMVPADPKGRGKNQVLAAVRGWPRWAQWAVGGVAVFLIVGAAASAGNDDDKKISAGESATTRETTSHVQVIPPPTSPPATPPPTTRAPVPTTAAGPKTTFGNGQYRVGTDIAPGTYVAPGGSGCYWERQATFGGSGVGDIIANDLSRGGQVVVTIAATDKGFKTSGCGTWTPG